MKHWKTLILASLVMLAAVGAALNLTGCVGAAERGQASADYVTLKATLDAERESSQSLINQLEQQLAAAPTQSEAQHLRDQLVEAKVKAETAKAQAELLAQAKAKADSNGEGGSDVGEIASKAAAFLPYGLGVIGAPLIAWGSKKYADNQNWKNFVGVVRGINAGRESSPAMAQAMKDARKSIRQAMGPKVAALVDEARAEPEAKPA